MNRRMQLAQLVALVAVCLFVFVPPVIKGAMIKGARHRFADL